jgi:WD40 repeat protein
LDTWETLHSARKAKQKAAAKEAPTPAQINQATAASASLEGVNKEMGVASLLTSHGHESYLQVISDQLYVLTKDAEGWSSKPVCTLPNQSPTALSTGEEGSATAIFVGFADGSVTAVGFDQTLLSLPTLDGSAIVGVSLHPDATHLVAATAGGHIGIGRDNAWVTAFASSPAGGVVYTAGALHPDGLIYLAGRIDGALDLWDFKNQTNAATLPNEGGGAVRAIAFSSNGYHVAVAYEQSQEVLVWDLRKQNVLAALNTAGTTGALEKVQSLTFDEAGKYLALAGVERGGGKVKVTVVTVKQWNTTYTLDGGGGGGSLANDVANGIAWNKAGIAIATAENNVASNIVFSL